MSGPSSAAGTRMANAAALADADAVATLVHRPAGPARSAATRRSRAACSGTGCRSPTSTASHTPAAASGRRWHRPWPMTSRPWKGVRQGPCLGAPGGSHPASADCAARAGAAVRKAPVGLQLAIAGFGFGDAPGAGAHGDAQAMRRPSPAQLQQSIEQAIVLQRLPGQAVVAAIPRRPARRQGAVLQAGNAADPGRERLQGEIIRAQAAAALRQRLGMGMAAAANGTGEGMGK